MSALFVVVAVLVALLGLFGILYFPLRSLLERKHFSKSVYRSLYHLAEDEDFYLLNNVRLYFDGNPEPYVYSHILFGEKYVYFVQDFTEEGGIFGDLRDDHLFRRDFRGEVTSLDNPVKAQEKRVGRLLEQIRLPQDSSMFVRAVVYNDSLTVSHALQAEEKGYWFLPKKELLSTIRKAEKDDVPPIKEEDNHNLVQLLKQISEKNKAYQKEESAKPSR